MFLLDDILLAPIKGLAAVCQKVHDAAQEDLEKQEQEILATLSELHQLMDAGRIGDEDFNVRECDLLDRLETCQKARGTDRSPACGGRRTGGRPWNMNRPLAGNRQHRPGIAGPRAQYGGRAGRRHYDHRGRYRARISPLAVDAQFRRDRPAGRMARDRAALTKLHDCGVVRQLSTG